MHLSLYVRNICHGHRSPVALCAHIIRMVLDCVTSMLWRSRSPNRYAFVVACRAIHEILDGTYIEPRAVVPGPQGHRIKLQVALRSARSSELLTTALLATMKFSALLAAIVPAVSAASWTATPFTPHAIPLAVRSPYLSAWLPQGAGTALNGAWPTFWTGSVRLFPILHFSLY